MQGEIMSPSACAFYLTLFPPPSPSHRPHLTGRCDGEGENPPVEPELSTSAQFLDVRRSLHLTPLMRIGLVKVTLLVSWAALASDRGWRLRGQSDPSGRFRLLCVSIR